MAEVDVGKALNVLARHQMIRRVYLDILADLTVCEIDGWDKMEYIRQLKEVIDHFAKDSGGEHDRGRKEHHKTD